VALTVTDYRLNANHNIHISQVENDLIVTDYRLNANHNRILQHFSHFQIVHLGDSRLQLDCSSLGGLGCCDLHLGDSRLHQPPIDTIVTDYRLNANHNIHITQVDNDFIVTDYRLNANHNRILQHFWR
jgi:hypothetical protein